MVYIHNPNVVLHMGISRIYFLPKWTNLKRHFTKKPIAEGHFPNQVFTIFFSFFTIFFPWFFHGSGFFFMTPFPNQFFFFFLFFFFFFGKCHFGNWLLGYVFQDLSFWLDLENVHSGKRSKLKFILDGFCYYCDYNNTSNNSHWQTAVSKTVGNIFS